MSIHVRTCVIRQSLNARIEQPLKKEQQRLEVHRSFRRDAAVVPRLAEYFSTTIKKGSHVLVEGSLVSTTYERGNGKGKKANQQADVLGEYA